jgi:replicative DNA helicase
MDQKFKRKPKEQIPNESYFQHGKVPPQSVDLEEVVLGAMMLEKDALISGLAILQPEHFYKEAHQVIFASIQRLFRASNPVDILTVTDELRKSGELEIAGGPYYITMCTNRVAGGGNIEYHAHIILQKYLQREMIREGSDLVKSMYDDTEDVIDVISTFAAKLIDGFGLFNRRQMSDMGTITREVVKKAIHLSENPKEIIGIPSGIFALDEITQGSQDTDLIIIAARPGQGKTALLITEAHHIGINLNTPVGIFSMEMSKEQLGRRMLSVHSGIDHAKILSGKLAEHEKELLNVSCTELDKSIHIDDTAALNIIQLRAKAIELKRKHKVCIIFVDYLQLMSGAGQSNSREQEISQISRGLKALAKELNIPIVALSQLNRESEKTADKKPGLSHLRESGAIEQDADQVIFIYRPSMYKIPDVPEDEAWLMVAKNRNGACFDCKVQYIAARMLFRDQPDMSAKTYEQYKDPDQVF